MPALFRGGGAGFFHRSFRFFRGDEQISRRGEIESPLHGRRRHIDGIESLDALDRVAEKRQSVRQIPVGRIYRQYISVKRERVFFFRGLRAAVSHCRQSARYLVGRYLVAHGDRQRRPLEPVLFRHVLQQRFRARHAAKYLSGRDPDERRHSLRKRLRLKLLAVYQHVVFGRKVNGAAVGQPFGDPVFEFFRRGGILRNNEYRPARMRDDLRLLGRAEPEAGDVPSLVECVGDGGKLAAYTAQTECVEKLFPHIHKHGHGKMPVNASPFRMCCSASSARRNLRLRASVLSRRQPRISPRPRAPCSLRVSWKAQCREAARALCRSPRLS